MTMILPLLLSLAPATVTCTVTDGDTLRCDQIGRVRLLGIDAPELPGHCRKGRVCVPGDGPASKRSLERMVRGPVTIQPVTRDRYGRVVAQPDKPAPPPSHTPSKATAFSHPRVRQCLDCFDHTYWNFDAWKGENSEASIAKIVYVRPLLRHLLRCFRPVNHAINRQRRG